MLTSNDTILNNVSLYHCSIMQNPDTDDYII